MDRGNLWQIMTTETILSIMDSKTNNKVFVPLCEPVQFTKGCRNQGITIHPYVLGCLLGDGCFSEKLYSPQLTSVDNEIIDKIKSLGYDIHNIPSSQKTYYIYDKEVVKALKQKNLWGKHSYEKFIPECYKTSYIEDRFELLQGLLDTDGTVDEKGNIEYYTTSKRLCDDVVWIIRSLGGWASVHSKKGKYKKGEEIVECRDCYRVSINIRNPQNLFHLTRKKERLKTEKYRGGGSDEELAIVSYKILSPTEMRCVSVSHPNNLYLTNGFTVTHNSFGAAMATAEPSLDSRWCGLFLRNNLDDIKRGGGLIDSFRELYGNYIQVRISDMPRVTFPSGAFVDFTHVADQTKEAILRRLKGSQYDMIYFDELSNFSWEAFTTILSRNRGKSPYAGKCLATTNPEREHWTRDFIDWYVDESGYIIPERDGVVRFFYIMGTTVKDVCWGNSKEEVYMQCKADIDKILRSQHSENWEEYIKSFTFYEGKMSENKEMLERNKGYVGTIAMMGGAERDKLLGGNWNVSSRDEQDCVLTYDEASSVFTNDDQINGDRWITVDLADSGTNNFVQIAWDGLHIVDIDIAPFTTPAENARRAQIFAAKHDVGQSHIIFDAIRGMYFKDYLQQAIPYESYRAPFGLSQLEYVKLKDCCYGKLIWLVKNNLISCSDDVAMRRYVNAASKTTSGITVQNEFCEEARVIRWVDAPNGKKRLATKKELNKMLGRGRSMDVMDCISMRMMPLLNVQNGFELETGRLEAQCYNNETDNRERVDIYDDSNFGINYGQ